MQLVKPLCRVCERPTADGAVQAVQLDTEKLQTWLLNVCGHEFAEEIEDEDLICYFCIWHAEFHSKYVSEFEALAWWTPHLVHLDDVAKELRRKYLEGKAEQCWVQLEQIELPESETKQNGEHVENSDGRKSGKKCFYCGQVVVRIRRHVRNMHANAIRCDYRKCVTYFHTDEEKNKHTNEVHEKSKAKRWIKCNFCERVFRWTRGLRKHVRCVHSEFQVLCDSRGCLSYFKTEFDMKNHFDSAHKKEEEGKVFKCQYCKRKFSWRFNLKTHISRFHLPNTVKCDKCDKMFASKQLLAYHVNKQHTFWMCKICNSNVTVDSRTNHLKKTTCKRCKNLFECLGLYQSHLKTCMQTLLKCQKCPKTFQYPFELKYHLKMKHRNNSWRGLKNKNLGFKCEPCKRYYKNEIQLKIHLNRIHKRLNLKHCAHCSKSFTDFVHLKNHLAVTHFLIERKFECEQCEQKFVSSYFLNVHKMKTHLKNKILEACKVCGKTMARQSVKRHCLTVHGIENP